MTKGIVKVTEEEFMMKIAEGERDFSGVRLEDIDFNRYPELGRLPSQPGYFLKQNPLILNGSEVYGLKAEGFEALYFQADKTNFFESSFDYSHLGGSFRMAGFYQCTLECASFLMADLEKAKFHVSKLPRANFRTSKMRHAKFGECNLWNAYFRGDLRKADFNSSALAQAIFEEADLRGASFVAGRMDETTSFVGCDLRGALFLDTESFDRANFARCKVTSDQKKQGDKAPRAERFVLVNEEE